MRVMHMKHASTINRGACFIWAWLCSLYNPGIRLVSTEGHAVVSFGQQCFDAEGQARLTERAYLQDTVEFSAYWTGHGKYRSTFEPIARPLLPGSDKPRFRALRGEGEPHGEEFRF
jgi:hypothetical protein